MKQRVKSEPPEEEELFLEWPISPENIRQLVAIVKGLTPSLDWKVEKEEIQIKYEEIESDFDVETSSSTCSDRIVFYIIIVISLCMLLYIILFSDNSTFSFHIFKDFLIENKEGRKCILRRT